MNTFTVSFFGHRILDDPFPVEQKLEALLCDLLREKDYVEFLVGRNGDFDQLVSSTVRRCKKKLGDENSALVLILPYETAEYRNNENALHSYYDEIEIFSGHDEIHHKAVFQTRNRSMTDRSDLIIFYVTHSFGGAYQTMRYARQKEKTSSIWQNESMASAVLFYFGQKKTGHRVLPMPGANCLKLI